MAGFEATFAAISESRNNRPKEGFWKVFLSKLFYRSKQELYFTKNRQKQ
jgi:hypothetical protein